MSPSIRHKIHTRGGAPKVNVALSVAFIFFAPTLTLGAFFAVFSNQHGSVGGKRFVVSFIDGPPTFLIVLNRAPKCTIPACTVPSPSQHLVLSHRKRFEFNSDEGI